MRWDIGLFLTGLVQSIPALIPSRDAWILKCPGTILIPAFLKRATSISKRIRKSRYPHLLKRIASIAGLLMIVKMNVNTVASRPDGTGLKPGMAGLWTNILMPITSPVLAPVLHSPRAIHLPHEKNG